MKTSSLLSCILLSVACFLLAGSLWHLSGELQAQRAALYELQDACHSHSPPTHNSP